MSIAGTFISNAAWTNTGYGTQTRQLVTRMTADGHQFAVQANYGLESSTSVWNGILHYPRGFDAWSNDMVGPAFKEWTANWPDHRHILFGLFDAWVMNADILDEVPVAWWTPIDHMPAPRQVLENLRKPNWHPIAMSKFGERMLHDADVDCFYAPHAIDTALYAPTPDVDGFTGREAMGLGEDVFVVSSFDANKAGGGIHRKAWGERLLAFSIFAQHHDDVVLYLHTEQHGAMAGYKFEDLIAACALPESKVRFVNQWAYRMGIPDKVMAALYTASDVVLMPSLGEGFGLCALECQAAGTPVILNDSTAQPELLGDGWLVPGQPLWDAAQAAWWSTPNVGSIVDALEAAYQRGRGRSRKAIDFAAGYDADVIYDTHWRPILKDLEDAA